MKMLESLTALLIYAALVTFVYNGFETLVSNYKTANQSSYGACYTCNSKRGN